MGNSKEAFLRSIPLANRAHSGSLTKFSVASQRESTRKSRNFGKVNRPGNHSCAAGSHDACGHQIMLGEYHNLAAIEEARTGNIFTLRTRAIRSGMKAATAKRVSKIAPSMMKHEPPTACSREKRMSTSSHSRTEALGVCLRQGRTNDRSGCCSERRLGIR